MSDVALYAVIATLLAIILGAITFFNRDRKKEEPKPRPQPRPVPVAGGGLPNRAAAQRNARARMRAAAARHDDESGEDSDHVADLEDEVPGLELPSGKIGKKKLAKLQAKAEKKAMREAEERERAEKKERDQEEYEERKKKEELRAAEEAKRKEEEQKELEERKRREHEEYLLMKASFEVEEEGFKESEEKETNLLEEFIQYIKDEKVVVLDELALKFSLKTQDVINRVMDLQNEGVISGVIDDRGKFIYITMDEMNAVAKFIKQRGRISIADLAESSNQLINLTPVDRETSSAS